MTYLQHFIHMLFTPGDPIGQAVNFTIVILFLVGVIDFLRATWTLNKERGSIVRAKKALADSEETNGESPFREEEALLSFLTLDGNSLIGKRVSQFIQLRNSGLGNRDALQHLSEIRFGEYGKWARYIANTLILIGLFGTVFGLSIAIVKVQGALPDSQDFAALRELTTAMSGTLQGMKTAFATTLAGLSTALLLSLANHIVRRIQIDAITQLEEFIACSLAPALELVDPKAEQASYAFANVITNASSELKNITKVVATAAKQFQGTSEQMEKTASSLHGVGQSFEKGIDKILSHQQSFVATMDEVRSVLKGIDDKLAKQFDEIVQLHRKELISHLEINSKTFEETKKTFDDGMAQHNQELQNVLQLNRSSTNGIFTKQEEVLQAVTDMVIDLHSQLSASFSNRPIDGMIAKNPSMPMLGEKEVPRENLS